MPYFKHFFTRFASFTLLAMLFVMPILVSAQTGYGGGGRGGGFNNPTFGAPIGQVLGASTGPSRPRGQVLGASRYNFTQTLELGSSGQDVTELQKILIRLGFLNIPEPTGYFGSLTEDAVKAYQTVHGLEPIGIVGPLTRAFLNKGTTQPIVFEQNLTKEEQATLIEVLKTQLQNLFAKFQALLT